MSEGIWLAKDQPGGDLAAVFEHDGATGWFYLHDLARGGDRILGAIQVARGPCHLSERDLELRWKGASAGLLIQGRLWAAFHGGARFGSLYSPGGEPVLPTDVVAVFCGRVPPGAFGV